MRRSLQIAATPERIWRELQSEEAMRAWFIPDMDYEPVVGGWVELRGEHAGIPAHFGGRVTVFDPPGELTFEWAPIGDPGWPAPTLLTIRLTPNADGTMVEILHHGFERLGPDAARIHRSFEGGWDIEGLLRLDAVVAG